MSVGTPDGPLHMALAVLITSPGIHQTSGVQRKAVPASSGNLCDLNAPQRSYSPRLLLIIPARSLAAVSPTAVPINNPQYTYPTHADVWNWSTRQHSHALQKV